MPPSYTYNNTIDAKDDRGWYTCVPRELLCIQLIVMKYFENSRLRKSQFSSDSVSFSNLSHATAETVASSLGDVHTNRGRTVLIRKWRKRYASRVIDTLLHFLGNT